MFTQTTVKIKYFKRNEKDLLDRAYEKFNEATDMLNATKIINQLEDHLEEQIRYKRNKEYLYTNCNRIKKRFYHYRDKNKHPRITICILYDLKDKIASRGVSLCSFADQTEKENGRDRAEDRAIKANKFQVSSERIVKYEAGMISESVEKFNKEIKDEYKSTFNVKLTDFEKRLFQIKE